MLLDTGRNTGDYLLVLYCTYSYGKKLQVAVPYNAKVSLSPGRQITSLSLRI